MGEGEEMYEGIEAVILELKEEYEAIIFKDKNFQYYQRGAVEALDNLLKRLRGGDNETL